MINNHGKNYKIIAIGDIRLQMADDPRIEKILAKNYDAIEEIWQKALKEKDVKLFNGTLPNFIGISSKKEGEIKVTAHFVEYKHFIAQRKQPDLKLGIKPIGVSGIIVLKEDDGDYIVFAERTGNVTEYPGFFELVPAGSIDKEYAGDNGIIDFQSKLLSEFTEETGLSKNYVKDISGFAFVLDTNHDVYDICCRILLGVKKESVVREFLGSKESHRPVFIPVKDLGEFVKERAAKIVPTSMAMIDAYMRGGFSGY